MTTFQYLSETAVLSKRARPAEWILLVGFAGLLIGTGAYEHLHRDEFLYAAYGDHPDLSYKEAAPLIGWAATLSESLLGKTAFALRLWPSLCMVAALAIYLRLMRLLGASLSARLWFGLAYALSPVIIAFGHLFQPSGFEVLAYALLTYAVTEAHLQPKRHLGWVLALAAAGLYAKFSFLYLGGSMLIACFLLPETRKRLFHTRWTWWLAGLLLVLPLGLWQYIHHWPFLAHMQALEDTQLHHQRPFEVLLSLPLLFVPGALLLFASPYSIRLRQREHRVLRPVLLAWLVTVVFLIVSQGKHYYLATPSLPLLMAGSLAMARMAVPLRRAIYTGTGILALVSLSFLPALIALPEPWEGRYLAWARNMPGLQKIFYWEDGSLHDIPQDMADKKGWDELAPIVQAAWDKLSPEERQHTVVFGDSYGEAGAANWYQKPDAGWTAITDNGSFSLWIKLPPRIDRLLYINVGDYGDLNELFDTITVVGSVQNRQARIYGSEVLLCTGPKADTDAKIRARMQEAKEGFMY